MDNEIASLILGAVMPPVVDFVRNRFGDLNPKVVYALAFITSIIGGLLVSFASGGLEGGFQEVLLNSSLVLASSQTVYNTYWKTSKVREIVQ